ncbi:hypothetical protein CapIbe_014403 [Capra ibex]
MKRENVRVCPHPRRSKHLRAPWEPGRLAAHSALWRPRVVPAPLQPRSSEPFRWRGTDRGLLWVHQRDKQAKCPDPHEVPTPEETRRG